MKEFSKQRTWATLISLTTALTLVGSLRGENRSIDGIGNNILAPGAGSANRRMIRFEYDPTYPDGLGRILNDSERANPRDISNGVSAQNSSVYSARGLTDFIWVWGQFLGHDVDLSTGSNGAAINGTAPIAINNPLDPLGPTPIPFTRSNFQQDLFTGFIREQFNEVTSFIDASNVYGSDLVRAAALRTGGGTGAKLLTSSGELMPFNTVGLPNENTGTYPAEALFLAGDLRSNENVLLTSIHTVFVREHNRLVDKFADAQFGFDQLTDEEKYQLARKIVGAEMQIITYNEYLPALLGTGAPTARAYVYSDLVPPDVTQSFAHAAFRFGHSTVSSDLELINNDGTSEKSLQLRNGFSNPGFISAEPNRIDQLLKGAASVLSEEIDLLVIDDLRNFLFGPPGAGGMDLASLNIQRGRDHGLPDYNELRDVYHLDPYLSFDQITSNSLLQVALQDLYVNDINNIDAWVGMLAEDHLPGSSVGELLQAIIADQFRRTRDGDRLFYLSDDLGLYLGGELNASIKSVINLDDLKLSNIIRLNTSITNIQDNVFFLVPEPTELVYAPIFLVFSLAFFRRQILFSR